MAHGSSLGSYHILKRKKKTNHRGLNSRKWPSPISDHLTLTFCMVTYERFDCSFFACSSVCPIFGWSNRVCSSRSFVSSFVRYSRSFVRSFVRSFIPVVRFVHSFNPLVRFVRPSIVVRSPVRYSRLFTRSIARSLQSFFHSLDRSFVTVVRSFVRSLHSFVCSLQSARSLACPFAYLLIIRQLFRLYTEFDINIRLFRINLGLFMSLSCCSYSHVASIPRRTVLAASTRLCKADYCSYRY